jgi:hypothetical protein
MDFVHDQLAMGTKLRILTVIDTLVRRSVLANFLRSRYRMLPLAGTDSDPHQQLAFDVPPANENCDHIEKPAHLRGRPRKTAWPRIVQLVHQLASEHPDWQRKRLAFEAWNRAREEFQRERAGVGRNHSAEHGRNF